jgi:hypothetical protein
MPTETFKSKGAYQRWNAYRHVHGIDAPNLKKACIKGKGCHKVEHKRKGGRDVRRRA